MSALTAKATPAETDTMIVGEGNVLKKITFSQLFTYLKDKLGINTLNTNLTTNISVAHALGTTFCVYTYWCLDSYISCKGYACNITIRYKSASNT